MMLGGRAAESLIFGKITTGAQDDLQKVTKLAYSQVSRYGMSDVVGTVSFAFEEQQPDRIVIDKPYSQATARLIDDVRLRSPHPLSIERFMSFRPIQEVRKLILSAYKRTEALLMGKRDQLEGVAKMLLTKEVLSADDMTTLLGQRPFPIPSTPNQDPSLSPSW